MNNWTTIAKNNYNFELVTYSVSSELKLSDNCSFPQWIVLRRVKLQINNLNNTHSVLNPTEEICDSSQWALQPLFLNLQLT